MGMDGGCCIMRECPNPRICVLAISFVLIDEVRVEDGSAAAHNVSQAKAQILDSQCWNDMYLYSYVMIL